MKLPAFFGLSQRCRHITGFFIDSNQPVRVPARYFVDWHPGKEPIKINFCLAVISVSMTRAAKFHQIHPDRPVENFVQLQCLIQIAGGFVPLTNHTLGAPQLII